MGSTLYDLIFNKLLIYNKLYNFNTGYLGKYYLNSSFYTSSIFGFIRTNTALPYIMAISLIVFILFTIGAFHKITKLIAFILYVYITHKGCILMTGADQITTVLLLFSLFLPLDCHFSLFNKRKLPISNRIEVRGIAALGILLQIGIIYFFNAINKTGNMWLTGNAVRDVMGDTITNTSLSYLLFTKVILCRYLNYLTYFYEFLFIFILFIPFKNQLFRIILAIGVILFHLGIHLFMSIGHFYMIYIAVGILLLPNLFWEKLIFRRIKISIKENQYINKVGKVGYWTLFILIVLMIQKNMFFAMKNFTFSETALFHKIYAPFKKIDECSLFVPFISQAWVFYTPNPSEDLGFIRLEVQQGKNEICVSEQDPLIKSNHFKSTNIELLRLQQLKIRYFLDRMVSDKNYLSTHQIIAELVNIWSKYQKNRITHQFPKLSQLPVSVYLYSCSSKHFLSHRKLNFKKIKVFTF